MICTLCNTVYSLGLATEWIEIPQSKIVAFAEACLGLATEWIEIERTPTPLNTWVSLGLATEWIEINPIIISTIIITVSVLRPSGLK